MIARIANEVRIEVFPVPADLSGALYDTGLARTHQQ
jgi:hypothetical protein